MADSLFPKVVDDVYCQIGLVTSIGLAAKNAIPIVDADRDPQALNKIIESDKLDGFYYARSVDVPQISIKNNKLKHA